MTSDNKSALTCGGNRIGEGENRTTNYQKETSSMTTISPASSPALRQPPAWAVDEARAEFVAFDDDIPEGTILARANEIADAAQKARTMVCPSWCRTVSHRSPERFTDLEYAYFALSEDHERTIAQGSRYSIDYLENVNGAGSSFALACDGTVFDIIPASPTNLSHLVARLADTLTDLQNVADAAHKHLATEVAK